MRINLPRFGRILALVIAASMPSLVPASPQPAVLTFHTGTVSGSLAVLFDHDTHTLVDITSISLTIDHQKYKLKDVDFGFPPENVGHYTIIGGVKNGIDQVFPNTQDFMLLWESASTGAYFAFSRPGMKSVTSDFAFVMLESDSLAGVFKKQPLISSAAEMYHPTPVAFTPWDESASHAIMTRGTMRRRLSHGVLT